MNWIAWCSTIGLPKVLPLLAVGDRVLERAARDAERLRGDADAAAVEGAHRHLEAVALVAEAQPGGDLHSSRKIWQVPEPRDAELALGRTAAHARAGPSAG